MLIDPSNAASVALNKANTAISPEVRELMAALKLPAGQTVESIVAKVEAISAQEQKALLELKLGQPSLSPRARDALQTVLSSPDLKLVELQIKHKNLHTLTDLPLIKGQALPIRFRADGQLQLSAPLHRVLMDANTGSGPNSMPLATPASANRAASSATLASSGPLTGTVQQPAHDGKARPDTALMRTIANGPPTLVSGARTTTDSSSAAVAAPKAVLANAIGRTLPIATMHSELLNRVLDLRGNITGLDPQGKLSPASQHALKMVMQSIANTGISIDGLKQSPAASVKSALTASGLFYENKLHAMTLAGNAAAGRSDKAIQQDLKFSLLGASEIFQSVAPSSQGQPTQMAPLATHSGFDKLLLSLFSAFQSKASGNTASPSRSAPEHTIERLIQSSLARIQLQQYRTVNSHMAELPSQQNTLFLDIPIRFPDGFANIFLQLQEVRVHEKDEGEKRKKQRESKSKWRVFMELELDEEGSLAVEVTVLEKDVDAQFWANQPQLREKTAANLDQLKRALEQQGLRVTDLRCSQNAPPQQPMVLDYSLIDVST